MIQAIGLTSTRRPDEPPAVDDLTFEARPGRVTVLLGEPGAGKSTALRLMLQREPGRGVTLFRGRPLQRMRHPHREVGVLLGDVPGHPARTARGYLRMLSAAVGVPTTRADDVLDVVGLGGVAEQCLGRFSLGMDRRLGLAAALLGDPHTLLLDEPAHGLSPRETAWLHGLLGEYARQGGTVLVTSRDPGETARLADRVVTVDRGRLVADQTAADFTRTRLRPYVAVTSPDAIRLATLLAEETGVRPTGTGRPAGAREAGDAAETGAAGEAGRGSPDSGSGGLRILRQGGSRIAVYGSSCAAVGETAFRHGILVHQLTEETDDSLPPPPPPSSDATRHDPTGTSGAPTDTAAAPAHVPAIPPGPPRGPVRPLRYELRRVRGVPTTRLVSAASLAVSLLASLLLARAGDSTVPRLLAGWPAALPLPPLALGAGLLGALAYGHEFRYPALGRAPGPISRRLGLFAAKLTVCTAAVALLATASVALNSVALHIFFGRPAVTLAPDWRESAAGWAALVLGCAWAGLLAAALFRSTALGLAGALAVPLLLVPGARGLVEDAPHSWIGFPGRLLTNPLVEWPSGNSGRWTEALRDLASQPLGQALALSLAALLGGCLVGAFRRGAR